MANVIDFKVFLTKENNESGKPEIRRFCIDSDVVTSYTYLREKLQNVFPDIRNRRFSIYWKDIDSDLIAISSCEELQIALTENVSASMHRLYITLHSEYEHESENVFGANYFASQKNSKHHHVGVVCDGCNNGVYGFRYKCVQCPDYDLCHKCEAKGLHSEHCMIRIAIPVQWKAHYGKRLAHHINKFFKKASSNATKEDMPRGECGYIANECVHLRRRGEETPSWIDTLATFLNDWTNLPTECPMNKDSQKPGESEKTEQKKQCPSSSSKRTSDSHVEFLKNIGETIGQFLDPLGIDVNVQMKSDILNTTDAASSAAAATSDTPSQTTTEEKETTKFPGQGKKLVEDSEVSKASLPDITQANVEALLVEKAQERKLEQTPERTPERTQEKTPEPEGWTLLNNDSPPSSSTASPCWSAATSLAERTPKTAQPSSPTEAAAKASIYPQLQNPIDVFYHPNPKIQRAVEAMMQMGFANDGGWLTQLLVSKNGDISKALDVLQPVKK